MIVTAGAGLTATVDPSRGAKIASLLDSRGIEWLAQAAKPVAPGLAFTDAEMAGWDECAPSIIPCIVDGRSIPDHGDLWDTRFTFNGATVSASGDGYVFERTIESTPNGLRLCYRATATAPSMPFLWAAHPQFAAPQGTRVVLPEHVREVVDVMVNPPRPLAWNDWISSIDTVPEQSGRKVYVNPDTIIRTATIVRVGGEALELVWSDEAPYLGIWFDNALWSREPVIALEPSTGFYDSLTTAMAAGRIATLKYDQPLEWWVALRAL